MTVFAISAFEAYIAARVPYSLDNIRIVFNEKVFHVTNRFNRGIRDLLEPYQNKTMLGSKLASD